MTVEHHPNVFAYLFESRSFEDIKSINGYEVNTSRRLTTAEEKLDWLKTFQETFIDPYQAIGMLNGTYERQIKTMEHERAHALCFDKPVRFAIYRPFDQRRKNAVIACIPEGLTYEEYVKGALAPEEPSEHDRAVARHYRKLIKRNRRKNQ